MSYIADTWNIKKEKISLCEEDVGEFSGYWFLFMGKKGFLLSDGTFTMSSINDIYYPNRTDAINSAESNGYEWEQES